MEKSYNEQIIEFLYLIDDASFKERLSVLCASYHSLEIGCKMLKNIEEIYNILITQKMNVIKDLENICSKVKLVTEKIKTAKCPGCDNCTSTDNTDKVANDNIFH